jgi:polar amino acid transport system ATP-binding protein
MSNFISHVKGTSLASVITVRELLLTTQMIYATTFRAFQALTVCAGLYLILTTALTGLQMFLERHLAFERRSLSSRRSRAYSAGRGLPIFSGTPGTRSAQASMDTVLEIKGLKKDFGGTAALCGIDLRVKRGEVICLIGPSGSGKSTLLRCINLLEVPDAGHLKISTENQTFEFTFGKAGSAISRRTFVPLRTHVGMVFQHFNLWPHKVAVENVSEALRCVRGVPFDAAVSASIAMLDRVGLADKITAFPDHLSGGQRQRVAIARALAMQPSLMLFDEPTSALDPESVGEVLQVIENVARSGMTMLVATHEMGFARKVADRILFLDRGSVVEDSSAEEFFNNPTNPRSLKFLTSFL